MAGGLGILNLRDLEPRKSKAEQKQQRPGRSLMQPGEQAQRMRQPEEQAQKMQSPEEQAHEKEKKPEEQAHGMQVMLEGRKGGLRYSLGRFRGHLPLRGARPKGACKGRGSNSKLLKGLSQGLGVQIGRVRACAWKAHARYAARRVDAEGGQALCTGGSREDEDVDTGGPANTKTLR